MGRRTLLVSDLDGTLLGDDEALTRFAAWLTPRRPDILVVYATGRFFPSVADCARTTALPAPDAVIGGVGTEILGYPLGSTLWSPRSIVDAKWDTATIRDALRGVAGLTLQPEEFQSPFKVSFYLDDAGRDDLVEIAERLRRAGITADIVYSSDRDLDVLPAGVSKGHAVARVAELYEVDRNDVIVAGDTGNDRTMFEQGYRGIVVANATSALKALAGELIYHARGCYAAGVLEGLEHWLSQRDRHEPSGSSTTQGHRGPAHERDGSGVQRL